MLSLSEFVFRPTAVPNFNEFDLNELCLRHFPDANDRTLNDPMYFVPSEQTLKFVQQIASFFDLDPVNNRSNIALEHLLLLRDYALGMGWSEVYLSGRQLVLEKRHFLPNSELSHPTNNVSKVTTAKHIAVVDLDYWADEQKCGMGALIPIVALEAVSNTRATIQITSIAYMGLEFRPLPDGETKFTPNVDGNPRKWRHTTVDYGIDFTFNAETGTLSWVLPHQPVDASPESEQSASLPRVRFEVEYSITEYGGKM